MVTVTSREPILHELLASVRFFNGRLLTGDALTREQRSLQERLRLLGLALGTGVARGLEVSTSASSTATAPQVLVHAGEAINPSGTVLALSQETTLSLTELVSSGVSGTFAPVRASGDSRVDGLYLLALMPSPVTQGRVLCVGAGSDNVVPDRVVDGVQLVVIAMDELEVALERALKAELADQDMPPSVLRNAVAHHCLAGAVEALLACDPTQAATAVPLAVLFCTPTTGVAWVDPWCARRPLLAAPWGAEAETALGLDTGRAVARLAQFHSQLAAGATSESFRWLPAAGEISAACDTWEEVQSFLDALCPPEATPIDEALAPGLLARGLLGDVIDRESDPRATIEVFQVLQADGSSRWLYARSAMGRLELRLDVGETALSPAEWATVECTATNGGLTWTLSADEDKAVALSGPLPAGLYEVTVTSDVLLAVRTLRGVRITGGQVRALTIRATRSDTGQSEPTRRHYL